jgi:hypothetical protein
VERKDDMSREDIERTTKITVKITREMMDLRMSILRSEEFIKKLDVDGELTIPCLNTTFKQLWREIEYLLRLLSMYERTYQTYESKMNKLEKRSWEEFFDVKKLFDKEVSELKVFEEGYKYFEPKNSEKLKKQARQLLKEKGYIVDSSFEGDYVSWIGVYARPEDKPTYLDPVDGEEVALQERHSIDGLKQDFAEWFEWSVVNGQLVR